MRCVLLSLMVGLPASAYVTPDGDRARWDRPPSIGLAGCSADLPAAECAAAVQAAVAQWSTPDLPLAAPRDGQAQLTVAFVADRPDLVGVLGVTTTTTEGQGSARRIVAAEVILNDDFDWSIAGPRGTFHVQATTTHEIGHALGLAHSPHRDATMYWHYDPAGADLAEDDRRGLQFLYGDRAGLGAACDQCILPDDCASGVCLNRPEEGARGFCADRCAPDRSCPAGERCIDLNDGGTACIPEVGFCADGGGLRQGEYCWGPFQCGRQRCAVFPANARCAGDCDDDAVCEPGSRCMLDPVDLPRVCLPAGAAPLGEACTWATDCQSGVCLPSGVCGQRCEPGCPEGWQCAPWRDANVCWPLPAVDMGVVDMGVPDMRMLDARVLDMWAVDDGLLDTGGRSMDMPISLQDGFVDRAGLDRDIPPAPVIVRAPQTDGCALTPNERSDAWLWLMLVVIGRPYRMRGSRR
jgi:hypothetical protein